MPQLDEIFDNVHRRLAVIDGDAIDVFAEIIIHDQAGNSGFHEFQKLLFVAVNVRKNDALDVSGADRLAGGPVGVLMAFRDMDQDVRLQAAGRSRDPFDDLRGKKGMEDILESVNEKSIKF
jgi:hypothetical protein